MTELIKINLEYSFNTLPNILYYRLSDPSGLEEWFAKKVIVKGKIFTFKWAHSEQQAELLEKRTNEFVRFRWLGYDEDTFFEFSIHTQELTGDLALKIIDFVEDDEMEDMTAMWNEQVDSLKHTLGV